MQMVGCVCASMGFLPTRLLGVSSGRRKSVHDENTNTLVESMRSGLELLFFNIDILFAVKQWSWSSVSFVE